MRVIPMILNEQWLGSNLQGSLRGAPVVFAIRHEPTRSIYFGASHDAAEAFYAWYQRLRALNTTPKLSPSFRAIYTKREDFNFMIVQEYEPGTHMMHVHAAAERMYKQVKLTRRDKCLNMNRSREDTDYWRTRIPTEKLEPISA